MKIKAWILTVLVAGSAALPHISKVVPGTILTTTAITVVLSNPPKCEAAGPGRAFAAAAVMLQPAVCRAGVMDQLCSSVTNFLNEESAKADADAKSCKKNCGWKKRKDDLLDAAKKKAKESCAKGEAPDAQELSKGLDKNTKDRLKDLYDRNSRMFDGKAKLEAVDFNAAASKNATITGKTASLGKGGQVTDLKSSEPATPKLRSGTQFSLNGTKLVGDAANTIAVKQSPLLSASAAPAATSADIVSVVPKSQAATSASADVAVSTQTGETAVNQKSYDDCINTFNSMIKSAEDRIVFEQNQIVLLQKQLTSCKTPSNCSYINSQISDANISINTARERITENEAEKKNLSPDIAVWNCRNVYDCPGGAPRAPDDTCCPAEQDLVKGTCAPKCSGGQIRNAAAGKCECPEGATLVEGKCQCPLGQIVVGKKCGCPAEQTLTAEGKCACTDEGKVATIAEICESTSSKKGRSLTFEEMETAKRMFGDTIDYKKVKIITGKAMTFWGKILTLTGKAVVWGNTIYFPNNKDGSSKYDPELDSDWLMHEMTHIYQRQNDGLLYILKAIWEQLTKGDAAYEYLNALVPDKAFKDYGVEKQAAMIQDYYLNSIGEKIPPLTPEQKESIEKMLRDGGLLK